MNQLNQQQIGQHVLILGWLHIIGSALFLAIAVFVFFLLTTIGAISGEAEALAVLSIIGTGVAALLTAIAIPGFVAGIGLLRRKNWGRILAIVAGILNLVNFPIGTIIGGYTLWVLFQNAATDYFENEQQPYRPHIGQPVA